MLELAISQKNMKVFKISYFFGHGKPVTIRDIARYFLIVLSGYWWIYQQHIVYNSFYFEFQPLLLEAQMRVVSHQPLWLVQVVPPSYQDLSHSVPTGLLQPGVYLAMHSHLSNKTFCHHLLQHICNYPHFLNHIHFYRPGWSAPLYLLILPHCVGDYLNNGVKFNSRLFAS